MLAEILYDLFQYQIFKSVFFRGGMTYLTTYLLINLVMPKIIRLFRKKGITSDFQRAIQTKGPYTGATPIMGGMILVPAISISTFLWAWINQYTLAVLVIMLSFALIGAIDDGVKVLHKNRIVSGTEKQKSYTDKADGISGRLRLLIEFTVTFLVIAGLYIFYQGIDGHIHIPMIPLKGLVS